MSVNLVKYKDSLLAAWKDVLDDKTGTNWALFGYEGQTNDIKFIGKGCDGIDELVEDLNSGKIMYAFLRVVDPTTSLMKNVLINWQGEGAPNVRKGTCANHIRDISNFFKGAHVTINARTEDEVDAAVILDKVAKSSASSYKFDERADHNDATPVTTVCQKTLQAGSSHSAIVNNTIHTKHLTGSTYKRTIPKQEIDSIERDRFWEQQEVEEKQRQESERRRIELERKKAEEERVLRDSQETARREAQILQSSKHINQIRLAEQQSYERTQSHQAGNTPTEDLEKDELERRNRAEILRRQRSEEATTLIAKRTVDARAVFEQNTSAGQLNQRRSSVQPRITSTANNGERRSSEIPLPSGNSWRDKKAADESKPQTTVANTASAKIDQKLEPTAVPPVKNGFSNGNSVVHSMEEDPQEWEDEVKHDIPLAVAPVQFQDKAPSPEQQPASDMGLTAQALYDYQAADDTEITFDPGDVISHIDQIDEGWWQGLGPDGKFGLFPANYVELIQ